MKKTHLLLSASLLWCTTVAPGLASDATSEDVAVIIGNKTYHDSDIPPVRFALNDAKAMRAFAKDVLKIRDENIIYLEDATQAKMQSAFGRKGNHRGKAFQYVKPDVSNLYVFYSGHGLPGQHDRKSYLLPVDAEIETAEINGYPTDVLYENLKRTDAKSVTVFLDACFSGYSHDGALIQNASGAQILPQKPAINKEDPFSVITAASSDQLASWDEENQHGLFTEYLLRALYGEADADKDGAVKVAEISDFLSRDMRYKARRTYNRDQIPTVIGDQDRVVVAALGGLYPPRPTIDKTDTNLRDEIISEEYDLTPVEENMFAVKNANVRRDPSVKSAKVDMIPKGEPIHVAAKVTDRPWYAVEKGDNIIGYVFADLLGEEKEIATDEENRFIRELKARLEKLEQQTRLSTSETLPAPPAPTHDEQENVENEDTDALNLNDMGQESLLKEMGAILARQSFILPINDIDGRTSLNYNWIRVNLDECAIKASVSFHHDRDSNKAINVHDRQVQASFRHHMERDRRVLRARDEDGNVISEKVLFKFGPFYFENRKDRRHFAKRADVLLDQCQYVDRQQTLFKATKPAITPPPPPAPRWSPPPKHPNGKRLPPPPRRNF